jgi:flavin-dependent dehydrogenase
MASHEPDVDVAIIGGGPAGSTLASYLGRAGIPCAVFERELFPRPHVGESMVPSSTRIFDEIGFLPEMEKANFIHKFGAIWTTVNQRRQRTAAFGHQVPAVAIRFAEQEEEGVHQPYTYHVDRAKLDLLLLQHAHKLGARVYEGLAVERVDFDQPAGPEVVTSLSRKEVRLRARIVVDASGRRTLLGSQLKLKVSDPSFDQFAIHTWFEGFDRGASEESDYIVIHFLPLLDSWVWQIPITATVTSIGVVTQRQHFARSKESREAFFWSCIGTRPELRAGLEAAARLTPFKEEGNYSYSMQRFAGDGFVLIGDAARFVDPIFSSGVSVAITSAKLASQAIVAALASGDTSRRSFAEFETRVHHGVRTWYNFVTLYYRLNLLFTVFVGDPRYRGDVIKLLQGEVWDDQEPPVLAEMRRVVSIVERDPDHVWHHLLGTSFAHAVEVMA